jgi:hypothetical protein
MRASGGRITAGAVNRVGRIDKAEIIWRERKGRW